MSIQTDYRTPMAALGRRAHCHHEALSLAAFLVDKVWLGRATALTEKNRDDSIEVRMETKTFLRHPEGANAQFGVRYAPHTSEAPRGGRGGARKHLSRGPCGVMRGKR